VTRLSAMADIECPQPRGQWIDEDGDLCRYQLEQGAVVPGRAFGLSPYFRISYAASEDALTRALDRIDVAVRALD